MFITLEGIEGSGKTTQMLSIVEFLEARGRDVLVLREPGGTPLGDMARDILLNSSEVSDAMTVEAELLLYETSRAELVSKVICPALSEGRFVVCDRFTDSTVAYQHFGRGLSRDVVDNLNAFATKGLTPDLTIVFDLPATEGLGRALKRIEAAGSGVNSEDRFEREAIDFHERVRAGYLELAREAPARIKVVNAGRGIKEVTIEISRLMGEVMLKRR